MSLKFVYPAEQRGKNVIKTEVSLRLKVVSELQSHSIHIILFVFAGILFVFSISVFESVTSCVSERLYNSKGPELRRCLFSLKQLFQVTHPPPTPSSTGLYLPFMSRSS